MTFLKELRRRNVFRVAAAYAVVSWLIVQVVSVVNTPLNLPAWFETVVVLLLAIGFPVAVLFAWAFELTPDGIKPTQATTNDESRGEAHSLDYALITALVVVAAVTVWTELTVTDFAGEDQRTGHAGEQSIAVLPFVDMSADGDQEYFGDGIAEELLNELTLLEGLQVAGRTSSFSYKNSDEDLPAIADALGVSSILEGSIRKNGDEVRITAQLINAADGYHIWSQTYDRKLEDIFAIQEDIASSVAATLGVRLGVGGANAFRGAGTGNPDAYDAYLQEDYERAMRLDENYAAAWGRHGVRIASTMWRNPVEEAPAIIDRAYFYVQRAVELDPDSAEAHSQYATLIYARMKWAEAEDSFSRALELSRERSNLAGYRNFLMRTGRLSSAQSVHDAVVAAERMPPRPTRLNVYLSLALGRVDQAMQVSGELSNSLSVDTNLLIALNQADAIVLKDALRAVSTLRNARSPIFATILESFDSTEQTLALLHDVYSDADTTWPSKYQDIALLAAWFGDDEFALQAISDEARYTTIRLGALWLPVLSGARQLPGFKKLVTDNNLVEYWRTYGWADACQPIDDDDFSCR